MDEKRKAELRAMRFTTHDASEFRAALNELLDDNDALTAELAAMTLERDAAVRDWSGAAQNSESPKSCIACAHCADADGAGGYVCEMASRCVPKWRGPVAAEGDING